MSGLSNGTSMITDAWPAVRDHIFISYRRDDARGASGRIYDWTRIAFGRDRVFRDVHSIGVGKWLDKINAALARSAVCVAVIGPRWANADNLLRLHDSGDMVRHELVTALASEALVLVPTLVEGAEVPNAADLPTPLRPLFETWNARRVSEEGWEDDTRRLIAEIVEATGLPVGPDLDDLLHDAGTVERFVAEREQMRHLHADQIEALRRTVDELRTKLADASSTDRPGLAVAFTALARGDSLAAEDAFEREYEAQHRTANKAGRRMAEAARNVANLALLRDVAKAVSFYRRALAADPEHAETARVLGHALVLHGDLSGAQAALTESLRIAKGHDDSWGEMAAHGGLGEVFQATGDLQTAHTAYSASLRLAEQRLVCDPDNTQRRDDLAVSHDNIGSILVAQGDRPSAVAAFNKALAIREALAVSNPHNAQWQRGISVSWIHIGDVLVAQGDGQGALIAYRKSLAICKVLTTRNTVNTEWQRDLSVSHDKIGDVLRGQGDAPRALAAYRKGFAIRRALARRDPANTEWQRDISVSHDKIGNVLMDQGHVPRALADFRKGLAICEDLASRDQVNTEWQRDLAVSHDKIGDVLETRGDKPGALAAFRKALEIREAISARAQANTEWQDDLSRSHDNIGSILAAQGDRPNAVAAFNKALAIREALAVSDPTNAQWQRDLSVTLNHIGEVLVTQGDKAGALAAFYRALAIREALAVRDSTSVQCQLDVAVSCAKLGALPHGQGVEARRDHLVRGRAILLKLKLAGRLTHREDRIAWFEQQIQQLPPSDSSKCCTPGTGAT